jgi:isopentenyl phosphate kinase
MPDVTLVKLGGSLITDKRTERTFHVERATGIARALAEARERDPSLQLIVGHGSGSFGHMAARRHGTMQGVSGMTAWAGFAEVARAASTLNHLLCEVLAEAGLPVLRIQPSAGTVCADGVLAHWDLSAVTAALRSGLVPLVYGDVAFDVVRGGTITSTETLFFYLAGRLNVRRILLLGEVEGVLGLDGRCIPLITPATLPGVEAALGGSAGADVTGGMETKVRDMVALVAGVPGLEVRILDGRDPTRLGRVLSGESSEGTRITA